MFGSAGPAVTGPAVEALLSWDRHPVETAPEPWEWDDVATTYARYPLLALVLAVALGLALAAQAAVSVSQFAVTPSTTQAGGHPTLTVSTAFEPPSGDVRDFVLRLPPGLTANDGAAPYCSRKRLIPDLCPSATKVGSIGVAGEAFGFEAEVKRNIYNMRPAGSERLRLGISIFGSLTTGGVAATLPVVARPDGALSIAVTGLPNDFNGVTVKVKRVRIQLKGQVRRRVGRGKRRRVRTRALLTNPRTCQPATSALELVTHETPPTTVTSSSTFVPTGCPAP
jgi:hypothetical protein